MTASFASAGEQPLAPDLESISQAAFVAGWTRIVGEPPAAMLDDRRAMIAMLVEAAGLATDEGRARMHQVGAGARRRSAPEAPRTKAAVLAGPDTQRNSEDRPVPLPSPLPGMLAA